MPPNSALACYAVKLVLVWGTAWARTVRLAELAMACVDVCCLGWESPTSECAGVVRSRLLYGAPIWAEGLMTNRRSLLAVRRLHRTVAIRVVRGSRTISAAAAAVLNGFPPSELQALKCREIYLHTRGLSGGVGPVGADVRVRARRALLDRWRDSLDTKAGAPGISVLRAVLPNWDAWLDGGGPPLTHRVTQVLTGHGCFAEYLHRIGKEATARCHHCDGSVHSAQHRLEYSPAWARPRRDLIVEVG
uniref:uncharacterized protein LOC117164236 n=1 Tax=Bombus vancouverensis nearcticus TaxID=2705178 RepID=UPI00143915F5|nr:uncharacterized protein LOC117164236 [Bombus vancouverensis nearcticus]